MNFSKLSWNTIIYLGSTFLNKGLPFLLIPVLTRYLLPEQYGLVSLFQVIYGILVAFIGLNLTTAVGVQYFKLNSSQLAEYAGTSTRLVLSNFLFFMALYAILGGLVSDYLELDSVYLLIALCISLFRVFYDLLLMFFQVSSKPLSYASLNLTRVFIDISITLLLVVHFGLGDLGRVGAISISVGVMSIFCITKLITTKRLTWSFNKPYAKDLLRFGIPSMMSTVSALIITGVDKIILSEILDLKTVGVYSIAVQISMVIGLVGFSINQAWVPFLFRSLSNRTDKSDISIVRMSYFAFIFFMIFAFLIYATSGFIIELFIDKEFYDASRYVGWLALAFSFDACRTIVINYFDYENKKFLSMVIFIVTAVMNVWLNYILISKNGAIGAAQATFVAMAFNFLLTWYFSNRIHRMPWLSRRVLTKY